MQPVRNFAKQLSNFEQEVAVVSSYVYAEMTLQHALSKSKEMLRIVNRTPQFWKTALAAFQTSAYIALGRIFDLKSPYNVDQLLQAFELNISEFSPAGLYARRVAEGYQDLARLSTYTSNTHTLTSKDIARLRAAVKRWRLVYERAIMPVRHQYLAHRQASGTQVNSLYGRGKVKEMWLIVRFLRRLAYSLRELVMNGRKPVLRLRGRYSPRAMLDKPEHWTGEHEAIAREVSILRSILIIGGA